jgi:hypothetical protein
MDREVKQMLIKGSGVAVLILDRADFRTRIRRRGLHNDRGEKKPFSFATFCIILGKLSLQSQMSSFIAGELR